MKAKRVTGQRRVSDVASIGISSSYTPDFWGPNLTMTDCALNMSGLSWGMVRAPTLNSMSQALRGLVFRSLFGTREYSQLRHAKNRAPERSIARAISREDFAWDRMSRYTSGGSAFWCLVGGSASLYALACRVSRKSVLPVEFLVGSGRPLETMAAATLLTAFLATAPEILSSRGLKVPSLVACMKAPRSCIFSECWSPSR